MGNRAVITTSPYSDSNVGVYVHWNGGRPSIEAFLRVCRELDFRSPASDESYAFARLAQVIATFFGPDGLSVGVGRCDQLDCDNGDNGTYLIGGDWEIVGRSFIADPDNDDVDPEKTDAIARTIIHKIRAAADAELPEEEEA